MPNVPPPYIRMMRPKKPMYIREYHPDSLYDTMMSLDLETINLRYHRLVGLSVMIGYWPESWQDEWAIEELLKWEGREDEIRRDQYYADFIVDENQQARDNERRAIESESLRGSRSGSRPVVLVVHESVPESRVDPRADVLRRPESDSHLRLERGVSGGHATDLQGKDESR